MTTIPSDRSTDSINDCRRGHSAAGPVYILVSATKSAGGGRLCRDIDQFRSAAFTPKAVSERDVAYWVLNASLREGTLWVFLIKRAWAVQAILQHSTSGHLVSGRGFWAPEGINCYFSAPDMMIWGRLYILRSRDERERGLFISFAYVVRVCCCVVEIWWIPPRICKLQQQMVVLAVYTTEYYSAIDFFILRRLATFARRDWSSP